MLKYLMKKKYSSKRNVKFFIPEKCSKKCEVINVNDDLSLVIYLKYKSELFKWNFRLENIPSIKLLYFRNQLEKLVLYKTFEIQVIDFKDGYIHGILFDKYKNKTVNSMFGSFISSYETKNSFVNDRKIRVTKSKLDTIFEEKETRF